MSHFPNVRAIIELGLQNDSVSLAEYIENTDAEIFADDLCYVIVTLASRLGKEGMASAKELMLNSVTDHDFHQMGLFDE